MRRGERTLVFEDFSKLPQAGGFVLIFRLLILEIINDLVVGNDLICIVSVDFDEELDTCGGGFLRSVNNLLDNAGTKLLPIVVFGSKKGTSDEGVRCKTRHGLK
jgi:hypothetical protein